MKYTVLLYRIQGGREFERGGQHSQYEEYVIKGRNNLISALNFERHKLTTAQVYDRVVAYSQERYTLNIESPDQIVGNCFIKQVEKAIKFSLIDPTIVRQSRELPGIPRMPLKRIRPNWSSFGWSGAYYFHDVLLSKLEQKYPGYTSIIEDTKRDYCTNKVLRSIMKSIKNEGRGVTTLKPQDIKNIFFGKDASTGQETLRNFKNIDLKTARLIGDILNYKSAELNIVLNGNEYYMQELRYINSIIKCSTNTRNVAGRIYLKTQKELYNEMVDLKALEEKYPRLASAIIDLKEHELASQKIFFDKQAIEIAKNKKQNEIRKFTEQLKSRYNQMRIQTEKKEQPKKPDNVVEMTTKGGEIKVQEKEHQKQEAKNMQGKKIKYWRENNSNVYEETIEEIKRNYPRGGEIRLQVATNPKDAQEIADITGLDVKYYNVSEKGFCSVKPNNHDNAVEMTTKGGEIKVQEKEHQKQEAKNMQGEKIKYWRENDSNAYDGKVYEETIEEIKRNYPRGGKIRLQVATNPKHAQEIADITGLDVKYYNQSDLSHPYEVRTNRRTAEWLRTAVSEEKPLAAVSKEKPPIDVNKG